MLQAVLLLNPNPLWGRKLVVIGDSLTTCPTVEKSYPSKIAARNNMVLVHNGRNGERLCEDTVDVPSCLNSYTNDIPKDADFILCQIGSSDVNKWQEDVANSVSDTDMSTSTFKGCYNNLIVGLRTNYPNAKICMVLSNNWGSNLGEKSEDTWAQNATREMTQWQKVQCQRLNLFAFDPVEDTMGFTCHFKSYPTNGITITSSQISDEELDWYDKTKRYIGTDHSWFDESSNSWIFQTQYMMDNQRTSETGNEIIATFLEEWMKELLCSSK